MSRYINEEKVPINQVYIEFEGYYPRNVVVNYTSYRLRVFEERPIRCNRCQRYGHTQTNCKSKTMICGKCGDNHYTKDCQISFKDIYNPQGKVINEDEMKKVKCSNCGENHPAFSRKCKKFKEAKIVKAVQNQHHLSFADALKNVKEMQIKENNLYGNLNRPTPEVTKITKVSVETSTEPTSRTMSTQTEIEDQIESEERFKSDKIDLDSITENIIKRLLVPILNFQEGNFIASILCEILSSVFDKKGKLTTSPKEPIKRAIKKFSSIYEKQSDPKQEDTKTSDQNNENDSLGKTKTTKDVSNVLTDDNMNLNDKIATSNAQSGSTEIQEKKQIKRQTKNSNNNPCN